MSVLIGSDFEQTAFNAAAPFASFLPGVAGPGGKPLWVFYANRGQCIASFGVRDRNGAILEFNAADKAFVLTPLLGFRSFLRLDGGAEAVCHEPFRVNPAPAVRQRLLVRAHEIEIEETNQQLGLRFRVVYFTAPEESLPLLVRQASLQNIGGQALRGVFVDGLPQIAPCGLQEIQLKQMSRTMQAFSEILHVEQQLPFYKLKVIAADQPEVEMLDAGFFAFTIHNAAAAAIIVDPEQVFGADTSLQTAQGLIRQGRLSPHHGRRQALTGCAMTQLQLSLAAGETMQWSSYYGHAPHWSAASQLRRKILGDASYSDKKRDANRDLIDAISSRLDVVAAPPPLPAYTRQAFLDNTLRGGMPVVIRGAQGVRVFHAYTRKHGDMERDYNRFEITPGCWSQGSANYRDVNQNRRCENYFFPGVGAANIITFFNLLQMDGGNPLQVAPEKFRLAAEQRQQVASIWPAAASTALFDDVFAAGDLLQALLDDETPPDQLNAIFEQVIGLAEPVQEAAHGEGYWVDHWIYNLDLLHAYAAIHPEDMFNLLLGRDDFTCFDSEYVVQPRAQKYVLRDDGSVRQLNAVVRDEAKAKMIAGRTRDRHLMRCEQGCGAVWRGVLMTKIVNLLAIKSALLDPFGVGLEMEADKPGWCDALNGLPALFASSTHEAYALRRWLAFAGDAVDQYFTAATTLTTPVETATLLRSLSGIFAAADDGDFFPLWRRLATARETFRAQVKMGVSGEQAQLGGDELRAFFAAADAVLVRGLASARTAQGAPVSYFIHEVEAYQIISDSVGDGRGNGAGHGAGEAAKDVAAGAATARRCVEALRFRQQAVAPFLEGAVHALQDAADVDAAQAIHNAVRQSMLYDKKLGMYRVNTPLDDESVAIGRSRVFPPGWLENESIFLHMHYKYLLALLRSGLHETFFADLKRGLVAFQDPQTYRRSPLENSSFIVSSRFSDAAMHGAGFVARLSGATAEWISMLLLMGLGERPFRMRQGELCFEPHPLLAEWLFTRAPERGFAADSFAFKLFGATWIVYENPHRKPTWGGDAVAPVAFRLNYNNGASAHVVGPRLPATLALALRNGELSRLVISLGPVVGK